MVLGAGAQRGFAESELRLALSMGRKTIEIRPSVWGGKPMKFHRKMKDSGGPGGLRTQADSQKMSLS